MGDEIATKDTSELYRGNLTFRDNVDDDDSNSYNSDEGLTHKTKVYQQIEYMFEFHCRSETGGGGGGADSSHQISLAQPLPCA